MKQTGKPKMTNSRRDYEDRSPAEGDQLIEQIVLIEQCMPYTFIVPKPLMIVSCLSKMLSNLRKLQ